MQRCLRILLAILLSVGNLPLSRISIADAQGFPKIPSTPFDYVDYAVTSPPLHVQNLLNGPTNNTPETNEITNAGATLGRVLFYDTRLSDNGHGGTSCASCHQQANGFSDPNQFSVGETDLTGRHSPGLSSATFYQREHFFWDERADTLEDQVLMPIESVVEMNSTLGDASTPGTVVYELTQTSFYPALFQAAFGDPAVTTERMSQAMAQFVRSMVSYSSKYDTAFFNFVDGEPVSPSGFPNFAAVLDESELRGEQLFTAHGNKACSSCHAPPMQVASDIFNIGLDLDSTAEGADPGVGGVTGEPDEIGAFKVASLRNVAVRGHYMHDGRFSSLEDVIDFYSDGIQDNEHLDPKLQTPEGDPFLRNLTEQDKIDLVAYLDTLTDETFLTSPLFSDPFAQLAGDFDTDGDIDEHDIDLLAMKEGSTDPLDLILYDLDGNGMIEFFVSDTGIIASDSDVLIRDILGTQYGDANLDLEVELIDLDLLSQGWNGGGTGWFFGDFNGRDGIELGDLDILSQWFNTSTAMMSVAGSSPVPEPSSIMMLLLLGAIISLVTGRYRPRAYLKC